MKTILILVPDLMFETRVADTAKRLGYRVESSVEKIAHVNLVVLGLENNSAWSAIVEAARAAQVPVLAFARHTSAELLRQAREAGCARVVVNSDVAERLPQLLAEFID